MILIADASAMRAIVERAAVASLVAQGHTVLLPDLLIEELAEEGTLAALIEAGGETLVQVVSLTQEDAALADYYENAGGASLALMARRDLEADALLSEQSVVRTATSVAGFRALSLEELLAERAPAPPPPPPVRDHAATIALDDESAALVASLVERGIGHTADEVVRRAVQGLAAALL